MNIGLLIDCIDFTAQKHSTQRRKDVYKTPYINHLIGVMNILIKNVEHKEGDVMTEILCAAVLHNTIEDTNTSYEELVNRFGKRIADLVQECSDDKSLAKDVRKRLQIENANHHSRGAKLIKLADKYYNLLDLINNAPPDWTKQRIDEYFMWASKVCEHFYSESKTLGDLVKNLIDKHTTQNS